MRTYPLIALLILAACTSKDGETGAPDDTSPDYPVGCITVDGNGGYALLADAITVASEGSEIVLCAGEWTEPLEVTKGVSIVGAGVDATFLIGGDDPALILSAAGSSVSGLTVQSSSDGVVVTGASVAVSDVKFDATGGWGLSATAASDLSVSGCTFNQNVEGGLQVLGGSAVVTGNTFENPTGYGVVIDEAATATISDNIVAGVTADKRNYKDGYGILVNAASSADISGNVMDATGSMAIKVVDSSVTVSNETWTNTPYGFFGDGVDGSADGITVDATVGGVYAVGLGSFELSNVTATADPELACSLTYADWATDGYGCTGVLVAMDTMSTLSTISVSGFNNAGVLVLPYAASSTPTALTDITLDNVGRTALYLSGVSGTVTGLSVTNLREPEMATPCTDSTTYYGDRSASMVVIDSDITLTDGVFADNDGWGISNVGSQVEVSNTSLSNHTCSGAINIQGSSSFDAVSFSGGVTIGQIWDYLGSTAITNSSFTGGHAEYYYEYDAGDGTITGYSYGPAGVDIVAQQTSGLTVSNTTFSDGDNAFSLSGAVDTEITGCTFSDYLSDILYASSSTGTVFSDNTVTTLAGSLVTNYYGDIEMSDNVVGDSIAGTNTYSYYTDGVLDAGYPASYTSYATLVYGYTYTADEPCEMVIDGLEVGTTYSGLISGSDCSLELSDIYVGTVGSGTSTYAVYGSWNYVDPLVIMDSIEIDSVNGSGVYLAPATGRLGYLEARYLGFPSVTTYAFYASPFQYVSLSESTFSGGVSGGVFVGGATGAEAEITSVSVDSGTADGFEFRGIETLSFVENTATGRGDGATFDRVRDATITDNSLTTNSGYGMVCSGSTLTLCELNDLSGNTSGEHSGCDDACGIAP